ncbi:unnamed protein product [Amoebophrya sp. A120]|nr:unnamed protein product [Amoebophrya sp. A120]|eukprot:GSA120T00008754001.1
MYFYRTNFAVGACASSRFCFIAAAGNFLIHRSTRGRIVKTTACTNGSVTNCNFCCECTRYHKSPK